MMDNKKHLIIVVVVLVLGVALVGAFLWKSKESVQAPNQAPPEWNQWDQPEEQQKLNLPNTWHQKPISEIDLDIRPRGPVPYEYPLPR